MGSVHGSYLLCQAKLTCQIWPWSNPVPSCLIRPLKDSPRGQKSGNRGAVATTITALETVVINSVTTLPPPNFWSHWEPHGPEVENHYFRELKTFFSCLGFRERWKGSHDLARTKGLPYAINRSLVPRPVFF